MFATSSGYGDVIPVERWRLLGPMTAMNGVLLFGWSTAVIFQVLRRTMLSQGLANRPTAAQAAAAAGGRIRSHRLRAGCDLPRHARTRARPRARGRLVRLVPHRRGLGRLRARLRAHDPGGDRPPQADDRPPNPGDPPVWRLLPGDA